MTMCEKLMEIKNLEQLLKPYIGDKTFENYGTKRLTVLGENYGSLTLKVDVKLKTKNNTEEILKIISKQIPESEFLRVLFNIQISFVKEMKFYNTILPTLWQFIREERVLIDFDFFAKFYGGRRNLQQNSDTVDEDAVILLENLQVDNYTLKNRLTGFNVEEAELILKDLALFHAVPAALKQKKPEVFDKNCKPFLESCLMFESLTEDEKNIIIKKMVDVCKMNENCAKYAERLKTALEKSANFDHSIGESPFYTITHMDYWVNNTMLKFENGKPIKNKMIDFQTIEHGLSGYDVLFFIFTSLPVDLIKEKYDYFIQFYYENFMDVLKMFKYDLKAFTYEAFKENLDLAAKNYEVNHILQMLQPVFSEKQNLKELKDVTRSELAVGAESISAKVKERMWFTISECAERNWI